MPIAGLKQRVALEELTQLEAILVETKRRILTRDAWSRRRTHGLAQRVVKMIEAFQADVEIERRVVPREGDTDA